METHAVRYLSTALAEKIARNCGITAQKFQVTMLGADDVSKLITKVEKARATALTKPMKLD